jgi:Protein of unknown function (DUF3433)
VVVALWRQLDYRAKQLMPWAEMAKGPATPDKSVMLDYVSTFLTTAMYRSLRNRHFVVFITITVFITLKTIMIASTSLLVLQNVLVDSMPTQLLVENVFRASDLIMSNGSTGQNRAAIIVNGIQNYNMSFPVGTTNEYTFQSFRATANSSASASAVLNGTVEYFTADIDCEIGDVSYSPSYTFWNIDDLPFHNVSVSTTTCEFDNNHMSLSLPRSNSAVYAALMQPVNCTERDSGSNGSQRLMISIGYYRDSEAANSSDLTQTMENVTAILCTPRYSVGRAIVIQNNTATAQQSMDIIPLDEGNQQLTDLSSWNVAEGVLAAIDFLFFDQNGSLLVIASASNPVAVYDENMSVDAFTGLFMSANPGLPLYAYMDPQTLIAASKRTFKALTAQIAHQKLLTPAQQIIEGSFTDRVDRVIVQEIPLRVMQGLLSATILMTIILGLLTPRHALPGPANCIGLSISVLHRSRPAFEPLRGSGICSMDRIRQIVSFYRFQTDISEVDERPELHVLRTIKRSTDPLFQTHKPSDWNLTQESWWRPLVFGLPAMSFTLLMPLIFVVALEVLLRYSDRHQGLLDIQPDSRYQYAWLFGPTLLLVLVATLFNMLDFEIESIHPFEILHRSAATARSSVLKHSLSKLTPQVLWDAIRSKELALGIATFSVMLAPFLSIIASGLYTIPNVGRDQKVQVQQIDWFNDRSKDFHSRDVKFDLFASLIAYQNLTYPQWTYNEIIVPKIKLVPLELTLGTENIENAASVVLKLPALRGAMNCSVLPESRINKTRTEIGRVQDVTFLEINFDAGLPGDPGLIDGPPMIRIPVDASIDTIEYFGKIYETITLTSNASYFDEFKVLLVFGQVKNTQIRAVQYLVCTPY